MKFEINKLLVLRLGFSHFTNARLMYNNLKKNDYARARTTILGKRGLRHILCFTLFVAAAILLFTWGIGSGLQGKIFIAILGVALGIYPAVYSFLFLPLAFNLTVKQLKLNKKVIGWIDLILLIIILIAIIALIVFLILS